MKGPGRKVTALLVEDKQDVSSLWGGEHWAENLLRVA